eukprot:gene22606-29747_t
MSEHVQDESRSGFNSTESAEMDEAARQALAAIANFHVLPPLPVTQAVWTSPFMLDNVEMVTNLSTQLSANTELRIPTTISATKQIDATTPVDVKNPRGTGAQVQLALVGNQKHSTSGVAHPAKGNSPVVPDGWA